MQRLQEEIALESICEQHAKGLVMEILEEYPSLKEELLNLHNSEGGITKVDIGKATRGSTKPVLKYAGNHHVVLFVNGLG